MWTGGYLCKLVIQLFGQFQWQHVETYIQVIEWKSLTTRFTRFYFIYPIQVWKPSFIRKITPQTLPIQNGDIGIVTSRKAWKHTLMIISIALQMARYRQPADLHRYISNVHNISAASHCYHTMTCAIYNSQLQ